MGKSDDDPVFRALRDEVARRNVRGASDVTILRGGPMDGNVVKRDAPAMRPDWYTTWPLSAREQFTPGRYVLVDDGFAAERQDDEE